MGFRNDHGALIYTRQGETLRIEPWGKDALRVRATMFPQFTGNRWALSEDIPEQEGHIEYSTQSFRGSDGDFHEKPMSVITNGRIQAVVNHAGVITFLRDGQQILQEYYRNYDGSITRESHCTKEVSREWVPYTAGDYHLTVRFESDDQEKIYGMGQYQQPYMDMKGCMLELAQKNSQTSVPFALSNLGYGFLWNNPAVGRVTFGRNLTEWRAEATKEMDYWITVADTPKQILANYTDVTGHAPMMPEDRMGLWQCKLRYRTQEEVLEVAREYKRRGIPLDVIVIDFFHWTVQGDWKFDKTYWPDPKAMCDELHEMGTKVAVSVWPSVDRRSENFAPMMEQGLLMKTERGAMQTYSNQGDCVEIDPFNPATSEYVWNVCKKSYADYGIDMFWLDNSEPCLAKYDYDNLRYYAGPALEVSNLYPQLFSRIFYDHQIQQDPETVPVNLLRCGWAGSQKYGNVLWSGDVPSTFESFRDQLAEGLSMGLAGIPWWTTDIGGFMEGNVNDPYFRQLLIRWYELAVFSAVLRMHGDREPFTIPALDDRDWGGGYLHTGQPNELWSYGEDNYQIMKHYLDIRLEMKPYIRQLYEEASRNGSPLMRTMFYEFPEDARCWDLTDQYMFGPDYLVAPILWEDTFERDVYLPAGKWQDTRDGSVCSGGTTIRSRAPLESIPVFRKV